MFRLWGKCIKNNRLVRDLIITESDFRKSRTQMVLDALTELCHSFDLAEPIWLDANIDEFRRLSHTRFRQDNFIETLDFDYLEIRVIEE
ncbi:hypothetical protein EI53_01968 [Fusobacterium naviforme]|nr:hypothetical protein F7P78_10005 [Fusobacterium naviforme]PSL08991.1 hypothetical protein EI53_01968 [Fusobacterium naviforme]STO28198.1 Uncharacterised protein [Fusobacterium naviforme]